MNWRDFCAEAPSLAEHALRLFETSGVVLVGTLRKDGSPRISPVETFIVEGELCLGMMWDSLKARDLLRDNRCTVHSALKDREAADGEFKLHGRALEVTDKALCQAYCDTLAAKIGWSPAGLKFHLFKIDIQSAGLFLSANDRVLHRWRAGGKVEKYRQDVEGRLEPIG